MLEMFTFQTCGQEWIFGPTLSICLFQGASLYHIVGSLCNLHLMCLCLEIVLALWVKGPLAA